MLNHLTALNSITLIGVIFVKTHVKQNIIFQAGKIVKINKFIYALQADCFIEWLTFKHK